MSKIVLTRNFKKTTPAKFCALISGQPGETAIELDEIKLTNVEVKGTYNTGNSGLESFGCGVVLVGDGELPNQPKPRAINWNGGGFDYKDTGESFRAASTLHATASGIIVS